MELHVWGPSAGLPSVDPGCLITLLYAKLAKFNACTIKVTNNPLQTPAGELPVLISGSQTLASLHGDIVGHMRSRGYNIDHHLSRSELADVLALAQFTDRSLLPAVVCSAWLDPKNYKEATREWYSANLRFPLSLTVPRHSRKRAEQLADGRSVDAIYAVASTCLQALNVRLHKSEYFFGDAPTFADVVVAAYIATCIRTPAPHPILRTMVTEFPALVHHSDRVLAAAYGSSLVTPPPTQSAPRPSLDPNAVFLGTAAAAMIFYALLTGLPAKVFAVFS